MPNFIEQAHPSIRDLTPYVPGKPMSEVQREYGLTDIIKLASNENPLGTSPKALQAIQASLTNTAIYPDGSGYHLKLALSQKLSIPMDHFTLGNGSDSLFMYLAQAYVNPGEEIIISQYSFYTYVVVANIVQSHLVTVPAKNFAYDLPAMLKAITPKTRLIFIANPNNPTGSWINAPDLTAFLEKVPSSVFVLLDEAYYEYIDLQTVNYPNSLQLQQRFPNVIISRTFSKIYGLAGLRIGYGISHPDIANILNRVRLPFNVCSPALDAACAALDDDNFVKQVYTANLAGMAQMKAGLQQLPIDFLPSIGNFITINVKKDANLVFESLLKEGIIVRPLINYDLPTYLRITIGTFEQNARFLYSLKKVLYSY